MKNLQLDLKDYSTQLKTIAKNISVLLYTDDESSSLLSHILAYSDSTQYLGQKYLSEWEAVVSWHLRLITQLGEIALNIEKQHGIPTLQIKTQ